MAKIKWHILAQNSLMRKHGVEVVQAEYVNKTQKKKSLQLKEINIDLGKHENHDWQVILEPTGPHKGKITCNTCNKHVTWLSEQHVRLIRQK